jgi:hypothetical protein
VDFFLYPDIGARVLGYIDLVDKQNLSIYDYKSTKSIERYGKTVEDLLTDPQALIYGQALRLDCHAESGVIPDVLTLNWCYVSTASGKVAAPKTKVVTVRQSLAIMEDGLGEMKPTVREMIPLQKIGIDNQDDVPVDLSACRAYGGCPYRDQCTAYQGIVSTRTVKQEKEPMSQDLLARLKVLSANKPQRVTPPTTTKEPDISIFDRPPMTIDSIKAEPSLMIMQNDAAVETGPVLPPDAPENVSPSDPPEPPPPVEKVKTRGRPAAHKPSPVKEEHVSDEHTPESIRKQTLKDLRARLKEAADHEDMELISHLTTAIRVMKE